MNIEPLESRIAPAKLLTLVDVDGDLISITTTKGTDAELDAAVTRSTPAGAVPGGVAIDTINLAGNAAAFDGTSISVTAKRGPLGGDGLVNVGFLNAAALDLGTVTIKGDLSNFDAGKSTAASKVAAINVHSATGSPIWDLNCSVGSITVKGDVNTTEIRVNGASLGKLTIGGSLLGSDTTSASGYIHVDNGTLGKTTIGGSIVGSDEINSGKIAAKSITSITVGGSLIGGPGTNSGQIRATGSGGSTIGSVVIKGDVRAGDGLDTGSIFSDGNLGALTIGGSVIGRGATSPGNGQIYVDNECGPVKIGGDLRGGTGSGSGRLQVSGALGFVTIGGSVIGGSAGESGSIAASGKIAGVKIGGSLVGGAASSTGAISASLDIGPITIGGDLIAGGGSGAGSIVATGVLGAISIGGSVLPGTGQPTIAATATSATNLALKSLTIAGSATKLVVDIGGADSLVGPVKVGGDWREGFIAAGVSPGGNGRYGDNDDLAAGGIGDPLLFSKIASITIGGAVIGTTGAGDHFGFVAQHIGALSIGGTKIPLLPGNGNDTDANASRYIISATRDFTVHEVA